MAAETTATMKIDVRGVREVIEVFEAAKTDLRCREMTLAEVEAAGYQRCLHDLANAYRARGSSNGRNSVEHALRQASLRAVDPVVAASLDAAAYDAMNEGI